MKALQGSSEYLYAKASRALQGEFPTAEELPGLIEEALQAFGDDFRYAVAMAEDAARLREGTQPVWVGR